MYRTRYTDATALVERYSHDVQVGEVHGRGVTESESAQVQALESHYEKMAETAGISKDQAAMLTGEARLGGGLGAAVRISADGTARWRGQTIAKESWDRLKDYEENHQVLDLWSRVSEASRRHSTATGDSETAGLEESLNANLTRMRRFEDRASLARQESESRSEQTAQVRAQAQSIDRDLGQPFFAWLTEREGADGRPIGVPGAVRLASPRTVEDAQVLREHAAAFVAERFAAPSLGLEDRPVGGRGGDFQAARDALASLYNEETTDAYEIWSRDVRGRTRAAGAPAPGEVDGRAFEEGARTGAAMAEDAQGRESSTEATRHSARPPCITSTANWAFRTPSATPLSIPSTASPLLPRHPSASTRAMILVVNPPRDRPMA